VQEEPPVPAESRSVPERIVDLMFTMAGSHPGSRPVHAKGLVCQGTFRASAEAPRMSRAEHLRGQPVPATIRLANSSGDPNVHDGQPNVRSMAVKLQVAGGKSADILANSIEGFVARTPEELLAFLEAQLPDPATGKLNPDAVPRFLERHPGAKAFVGRLMATPIPASYAQTTYHAEHAFRFTAADGSSRFGRYHWVPEAGEASLAPEVGSQRGPNFLREELAERLARGPVAFRLTLQVAAAGDPTDDPTALWPADRPTTELGRLEIGSISPTSAADEQRLIFDPANVSDGIQLSADPILLARSPAYGVSYARRNPKA
jgi:catalase